MAGGYITPHTSKVSMLFDFTSRTKTSSVSNKESTSSSSMVLAGNVLLRGPPEMNTSDGRCAPHTLLRCTPYPAIHWRVRVPQMPGIQNPCKCPTSEHQIKFRHPPCVPKARKEPSRCLFLRNWPENICDDRYAFSRVHVYWRVRVPSNCQIP